MLKRDHLVEQFATSPSMIGGALPVTASSRKWVVQIVVMLLVLGGLGVFAWTRRDLLVESAVLDARRMCAAIGLAICGYFCFSQISGTLIKNFGFRVTVMQLFTSSFAASVGNYLPLRAGTLCRGVFLGHCCGITLFDFGAVLIGQTLVAQTVAATIVLVSLVIVGTPSVFGDLTVVVVMSGAVLPMMALFMLPILMNSRWFPYRDARLVGRIRSGVKVLGQNPKRVAIAGLWFSGSIFCGAVRLAIIYWAFGTSVSIWGCLFVMACTAATSLLALTPGAIGFREGVITAAGAVFGIPVETGLLVATVERSVLLLCEIVIGGPSLYWMSQRMSTIKKSTVLQANGDPISHNPAHI